MPARSFTPEVQRLHGPSDLTSELVPDRQPPTQKNDLETKALDANAASGLELVELVGQELGSPTSMSTLVD